MALKRNYYQSPLALAWRQSVPPAIAGGCAANEHGRASPHGYAPTRYRRVVLTVSKLDVGGLTQNDDDVFDEVMDCGEDLGTAFQGDAGDNHEREYDPRDEAND